MSMSEESISGYSWALYGHMLNETIYWSVINTETLVVEFAQFFLYLFEKQ